MQSISWTGSQIIAPGIYSNMPLDDYHRGDICARPSVSSSGLRDLISMSPKHYWDQSPLNPNRAEPEIKKHFDFGRACHHLFVGEKDFAAQYVIRPDKIGGKPWNGRTDICKAYLAQQQKLGKVVLTPDDVTNIRGMAISLGSHPLVQAGILNGAIERSMFALDKETGLWMKARPDAVPTDSGDFADIKHTSKSVRYRDLQKAVTDYGYIQQAAMVMDTARALGLPASSFSLVFIEAERPWAVRVVMLQEQDIARGSRLNRVAMRTIAKCLADNHWPGPGDDRPDAEYLELPDWARKSIDDRLQYELRENL